MINKFDTVNESEYRIVSLWESTLFGPYLPRISIYVISIMIIIYHRKLNLTSLRTNLLFVVRDVESKYSPILGSWQGLSLQGATSRKSVELVCLVYYFFCNCARGFYYSGYAVMSCNFWGML